MAYDDTKVAVSKSQDAIRRLIYAHKGTGLMLVSQPPKEGFEAFITIGKQPYHIRVMATCKTVASHDRNYRSRSAAIMAGLREKEERRVWRVLFWHLKAVFEAADSGVIDIRNIIMPYVVLRDGRTLSDVVAPRMQELMTMNPDRVLGQGEAP